jgi:2-iminobutanoate/2-iminopropanoate deaminase
VPPSTHPRLRWLVFPTAGANEEWVKWFDVDPPARQGVKMPVRIPGMKVSLASIAEA